MILVLDFGSQYTQLIARRVREARVYCEIQPFNFSLEKIKALKPEGIILSGGPAAKAERREYGPAELRIEDDADLFYGFSHKEPVQVWMSHGDKVTSMPSGWRVLAQSGN